MAAEAGIEAGLDPKCRYLQKFRLYETGSNFYMVGRDKSRTLWRVLKIDRLELSELNIQEDPTTYSESECQELLKRIHEGNKSTGGLKFVTNCYGIVGFIKFLGPYYMLLITRRRQIGTISGHIVYAITKSEMIALPNHSVESSTDSARHENRYKKLLSTVDLTKDFFFSYSYHVMRSLQRNMSDNESGQVLYETLFVWNEFLTRGIRNHLKNTQWTVALVYGFFKQAKLSTAGKDFWSTLIARRSRHYAGTRYLKRGVNEKGRVANDVETEQIVFEDTPDGIPTHITSVVQNRGSIPLFWSQETSRLNLKPDIILQKDRNYKATRLHFENLVKRYGNPIIILNLIKTREKKPRESILRSEFAKAIDAINKDLSDENRLRFLHWDLHRHSRSKSASVLSLLGKVAAYALNLTGFFYCQMPPAMQLGGPLQSTLILNNNAGESCNELSKSTSINADISTNVSQEDHLKNNDSSICEMPRDIVENNEMPLPKPPKFQKGVLRTNCIDCLDRTNVAQFAYGLAALGHQLHALGFIDVPKIDLDSLLADDLMNVYEMMGDTLAFQYGGSAAHNKIFSERRGQWKAATQSQEFFRTLQRYYSNAYMDAEKQDAINLFLGYFQPQQGKPALWELDSDQNCNVGRHAHGFVGQHARAFITRSLSDGIILCESNTPVSASNVGQKKYPTSALLDRTHQMGDDEGISDSVLDSSTSDRYISYSRYTSTMPGKELFTDDEHGYVIDRSDESSSSNFLDLDWLSSSGNSCDEENCESNPLVDNLSTENVIKKIITPENPDDSPLLNKLSSSIMEAEATRDHRNPKITGEFSDSFVHWVTHGEALCH